MTEPRREHRPLYQSQLKRLLRMRPADFDVLECWLLGRERDIAESRDGLGMLDSVFRAVMGREPNA